MDDGFHDHPKVLALFDAGDPLAAAAAVGLWSLMLAWAKSHADPQRPDQAGHVPAGLVYRTMGGRDAGDRIAGMLVGARAGREHGLWEPCDPSGWRFHDFAYWQELEQWKARSEAGKRGARARWQPPGPDLFGGDPNAGAMAAASQPHGNRNGVANGGAMPTTPHHTTPQKSLAAALPRWREFYGTYPRKAKPGDVEKAWGQVLRAGADPDQVIAGARRFAADPNLPEKGFIPYPATWLRARSWLDEALPPRLAASGRPAQDEGEAPWDA